MDSSIIPLSLSLFNWAKYRSQKGAIKLHAVLEYGSTLPQYTAIGEGKKHDIKAAKSISFPEGSVLVADRAYVDFEWLHKLDSRGVYFVTRLKSKISIKVAESYLTNDKKDHILNDQDIQLMGKGTKDKYPDKLRIVSVKDEKK